MYVENRSAQARIENISTRSGLCAAFVYEGHAQEVDYVRHSYMKVMHKKWTMCGIRI